MNPLTIAQEASDKDFKWWFLVLLALMISAALWAFRYILAKSERDRTAYEEQTREMHTAHEATIRSVMDQMSASRERHSSRVESLQAEIFKLSRDVVVAMTAQTEVIKSNTAESEKVRRIIERIEAFDGTQKRIWGEK